MAELPKDDTFGMLGFFYFYQVMYTEAISIFGKFYWCCSDKLGAI